ncbi:MAG: hypothetical protein P8X82_13715 [Gemmatimonadales bacterium]
MASMFELAELAALMAMSLVLVVRVIFRPTDASSAKTRSATAARDATARQVLGPAPTRPAAQIYRKLLLEVRHVGLVIDWDVAQHEQKTMDPRTTLVSAARRQLSQRPALAWPSTPEH